MKKYFILMILSGGFSVTAAVPAKKPSAKANEKAETSTPLTGAASGATVNTTEAKIKYKSGKDVNFDELLIQGELKRPELSVVTGNVQPGSDGLLRLRENFMDRITIDLGEELP